MQAQGTFTVQVDALEASFEAPEGNNMARMGIQKTYTGDLKAGGEGEMLSVRTPVQGSAGYVALESVQGELQGKSGGFVLQHFGTMGNGEERLILEVVPDSATGELEGLRGRMEIRIDEGVHHYHLEYQL